MARGFAVKTDGSFAGWYGHENDFAGKGFLPGVRFVPDDEQIPEVPALRSERDAPPSPGLPSFNEDMITLLLNDAATPQEKADAKERILASRGEPPT